MFMSICTSMSVVKWLVDNRRGSLISTMFLLLAVYGKARWAGGNKASLEMICFKLLSSITACSWYYMLRGDS